MAKELAPGDRAPVFKLPTDGGGEISSAALKGRPYVLYFYPKDDTSGCTKEAIGFSEAKRKFDSAGAAATNLNTAIQSLSEFVRQVSPTNESPVSASTNHHPFNVLDYGIAAAQIGAAATNLNALLLSANQNVPQLERLSRQTKADADEVVRHAFLYGLLLVAILLAGAVLAGLIYRALAVKPAGDRGKSNG